MFRFRWFFFLHNLEVLSKTRFWGPFGRLKPLNPPSRDNSGIARLKTVHFEVKTTKSKEIRTQTDSKKSPNTSKKLCEGRGQVSFPQRVSFGFLKTQIMNFLTVLLPKWTVLSRSMTELSRDGGFRGFKRPNGPRKRVFESTSRLGRKKNHRNRNISSNF